MIEDPKNILKQKSLVDYIHNHTSYELIQVGKNYKCPCPFHNEKEGSFSISPSKNRWTCFGKCKANGDLIDFVSRDKDLSFIKSVEYLCGVYKIPFIKKTSSKSEEIKTICNFVSDFYTSFIKDSFAGKSYLLNDRKQSVKIINKFKIGYSPTVDENGWQTLSSELHKQKFSLDLCEKIGLIKMGKRGNHIDNFRGRIIFPIFNTVGDCIGFNTRLIEKNVNAPRYLLSNETDVFSRKKIFYGLNETKKTIFEKRSVVLVEGIFDFYRMFMYGIHNCMPLLGGHFNMIPDKDSKIESYYLMMDPDEAGKQYTKDIGSTLIKSNKSVFVCNLSKDPDETTRNCIKESIIGKQNYIDWYVNQLYRMDTIEHKTQILYKLSKMLEGVGQVNMCLYSNYVSKKLKIPLSLVVPIFTKNKPMYKDIYQDFLTLI